jgi:16S rRNA (cytidine1402-2'-O)-methyltransferase
MVEVLGPRDAVVAKELTKLHEGLTRGSLAELQTALKEAGDLKGEFVIVVAPPAADEQEASDEEIIAKLKGALERQSFRDAVRDVAEMLKVKRSRVYDLGLSLDKKPKP